MDYIIPLTYRGQMPDPKTLMRIKHPAQAILKRSFPGHPISIKFIKAQRDRFIITGFHGKPEELEEPISIINRANTRHSTEILGVQLNYEELTPVEDGDGHELEPETDETLRQEVEALEFILQTEQEQHDTELTAEKEYSHRLEGENKAYDSEKKAHESEINNNTQEIINLNKAVKGLQQSNHTYLLDLNRARTEIKKQQDQNTSLSLIISEMSTGVPDTPLKVMHSIIEKATSALAKHNILESMLVTIDNDIDEDIANALRIGALPLYVVVNETLKTTYASDEEIPTDTTPFEKTEYALANADRYGKLQSALETIASLRNNIAMLGDAVDLTKLAEKERELNDFGSEYVRKLARHETSRDYANNIAPIKAYHNTAKALVNYKNREIAMPISIPILITPGENGTTNMILPNGFVADRIKTLLPPQNAIPPLDLLKYIRGMDNGDILRLGFILVPTLIIN